MDPNICHPDELVEPPQYGAAHALQEIDMPIEIWLAIADKLKWPQVLLLSNTCRHLTPLRQALEVKLQHLRMPDRIAEGMLSYRIDEGSRYIQRLITRDGKRNRRALNQETEKGMDLFRQWWMGEPPAVEGWRQPQHRRHSDLGYAVLCTLRAGFRRYWRFRAVARMHGNGTPTEIAYRQILKREAEERLQELRF